MCTTFGGWTMPAYFFRSAPGAAELRGLARRESGRVCQRVLMIANLLEGMEHEEAARLAGLGRSAGYEGRNRCGCDGASGVFATLGLQLERVRAAQTRGTRVEVWFQDEARIGQKNSLTRVWGQTGSRPVAPKDLGFASAYVFGAVCPSDGKAAALIMPICNTVAMNHHLREISSQVADDAHAVVILDGAGWHRSQR